MISASRTPLSVTIVIPAYNEERYIASCLQSVQRNAEGKALEVIVVDNASTDATAAIAATFPGVRVVRESRKGTSWARQKGLEEARSDLVAYVDADSKISKEWLPAIFKAFAEDPSLACFSGPYHYFDLPRWQNVCFRIFWKCIAAPAYAVLGYMAVGGNIIARRSALLAVGGFDTSIEFYGDDTDIARRLFAVGKVRFDPDFTIESSGRRLQNQGFMRMGLIYAANYLSQSFLRRPVTKTHEDIR